MWVEVLWLNSFSFCKEVYGVYVVRIVVIL